MIGDDELTVFQLLMTVKQCFNPPEYPEFTTVFNPPQSTVFAQDCSCRPPWVALEITQLRSCFRRFSTGPAGVIHRIRATLRPCRQSHLAEITEAGIYGLKHGLKHG